MVKIRDINEPNEKYLEPNDELPVWTLIFGDSKFSKFDDTEILNSSIEFILATKSFNVPPL